MEGSAVARRPIEVHATTLLLLSKSSLRACVSNGP